MYICIYIYVYIYILSFYLKFYLAFCLAFYLTFILTYILPFYIFYLIYFLTFYLTHHLTFYLASYLTGIWRSQLGSGSAHWALELAVEVRQCPLRFGSRDSGPAVPTEIWRWGMARRRRRRKEEAGQLLDKIKQPSLAIWICGIMALAVLSVGGCCTIMAHPPFPEVRENYQYTQRYIIDIHNLRRCTLWRKIKSLPKNGKIRQNGGWMAFLASWVKQGTPWKKIMFLLHQPKGQTIFLSNRQDHASFRNHHWSENRMNQQIALFIYIYMYIYIYLYLYADMFSLFYFMEIQRHS